MLNTKEKEYTKKEIAWWYDIDLTDDQLEDYLINSNQTIDIAGFDTANREGFGNYIANKLINRSWPLNRDSIEYKTKFYEDFNKACKISGYKRIKKT